MAVKSGLGVKPSSSSGTWVGGGGGRGGGGGGWVGVGRRGRQLMCSSGLAGVRFVGKERQLFLMPSNETKRHGCEATPPQQPYPPAAPAPDPSAP